MTRGYPNAKGGLVRPEPRRQLKRLIGHEQEVEIAFKWLGKRFRYSQTGGLEVDLAERLKTSPAAAMNLIRLMVNDGLVVKFAMHATLYAVARPEDRAKMDAKIMSEDQIPPEKKSNQPRGKGGAESGKPNGGSLEDLLDAIE